MKRRTFFGFEMGTACLSKNLLARDCGIYEIIYGDLTFDYADVKVGIVV